jgi:hypothetical protein
MAVLPVRLRRHRLRTATPRYVRRNAPSRLGRHTLLAPSLAGRAIKRELEQSQTKGVAIVLLSRNPFPALDHRPAAIARSQLGLPGPHVATAVAMELKVEHEQSPWLELLWEHLVRL